MEQITVEVNKMQRDVLQMIGAHQRRLSMTQRVGNLRMIALQVASRQFGDKRHPTRRPFTGQTLYFCSCMENTVFYSSVIEPLSS